MYRRAGEVLLRRGVHPTSKSCRRCQTNRRSSSSSTTSSSNSPLPPVRPSISEILRNRDAVKENLRIRKASTPSGVVDDIAVLDGRVKGLEARLNDARSRKKVLDGLRGGGKGKGSGEAGPSCSSAGEAKTLRTTIRDLEKELNDLSSELNSLAASLPNSTHPNAPIGPYENFTITRTSGPQPPSPIPPPDPSRDHLNLIASPSSSSSNRSNKNPASSSTNTHTPDESFEWFSPASSSKTTGPSWPFLLRSGAILEMALLNYSMSVAIKRGFVPIVTPDVVRIEGIERCRFRPRDLDAGQTYLVSTSAENDGGNDQQHQLALSATAEIPIAISLSLPPGSSPIPASSLPLKYVAMGRAFRAEAGARGKESRGLYRLHQFSKVELFVVCKGDEGDLEGGEGGGMESDRVLEELVEVQMEILDGLGLSYRVMDMPTEELGGSAYRKYDIEAWMPGRGGWGEDDQKPTRPPLEDQDIPTPPHLEATAVLDYEHEEAVERHRLHLAAAAAAAGAGQKSRFAHSLNATAAAVPRLILALVENGAIFEERVEKGEGGKKELVAIELPDVLRPFWLGEVDKVHSGGGGEVVRWFDATERRRTRP